MGGNPLDNGRMVAPSSRYLVGYIKAKASATDTVQQTRAPVLQANSVMQPAFMTQQPMMDLMTMQTKPQQQQQMMHLTMQPMM